MGSQRVRHDWVTELNWEGFGFPGNPMVTILHFNCRGAGLIPCWKNLRFCMSCSQKIIIFLKRKWARFEKLKLLLTYNLASPLDLHFSLPTTLPMSFLHSYLSVQFSHWVMSDSLWPNGLQHTRPPSPSPTSTVYPNSCPLSWWCHLTISSSVIPFSSHLQSIPASGSFQNSQFFASGGQGIGSFSFSISPSNEYSRLISFRMKWLDLLAVEGTLESLLQHHRSKASILWRSAFFTVQLSHPYMTTGKNIALTR